MKPSENALKASKAVSKKRLWKNLMSMAQIGALPNGGVNRPALSKEDTAARILMLDWASKFGFETEIDEIANLYIRLPGTDPQALPILTGSHLDSQPKGGKFDGAYGVVGAFEALEAIHKSGIKTKRSIEIVAWTNEEGGRFQPGVMGSAIYAGDILLRDHLNQKDSDGVTLKYALDKTLKVMSNLPTRKFGRPLKAYIEAHIEQGPILETTKNKIGVVSGIQGLYWFGVEVIGEESHAGTTPLSLRRDALKAAISIISNLQLLMHDESDTVRFTVGKLDCEPGSPSTVPGRVYFTIDFRHPDPDILKEILEKIEPTCLSNGMGCKVLVHPIINSPPVDFCEQIQTRIKAVATHLGHLNMSIHSGAGHDAGHIAKLCPTGMIFIPCEGGLSHNEAESADASDLAAGIETLTACLVDLANS